MKKLFALILSLWTASASAQISIESLPAASGVTSDDLTIIENNPSGVQQTQKATAAQWKAFVLGDFSAFMLSLAQGSDAAAVREALGVSTAGGPVTSLETSQTSISAGAPTGHLLIRSTVASTAGRVHIEPNGNPTGTAAKLDWMFDPYQSDSTNYRIVNIYTKNYDAADASTTQGNNGIGVIGLKATGDHFGVWPALHFAFSDDSAAGAVPMKMYYFDTSDTVWRTPLKGAWRTGLAVSAGDYILAGGKLYQTAAGGTTGVTEPNHGSGDGSDGAVTWSFVRDFSAASNNTRGTVVFGDRDDLPKFGFPNARVQNAKDMLFFNNTKLGFLGNGHLQDWNIYSPSGGTELRIEMNDGVARYLRFNKASRYYQTSGLTKIMAPVTITSGDATPSVSGVELLVAAGSTAITSFTGLQANQEFSFRGNGSVTLTHSANLNLTGGFNKTPAAGEVVEFMTNAAGTTVWEKGLGKAAATNGVYTPTLTNVANLAASTSAQWQYLRVGSVIQFSGQVTIDPTAATTLTKLGISLPVASNLTAATNLSGTCAASDIAGQVAALLGDTTNDRAQLQYISSDITNQPMYCSGSYLVQ